MNLCCLVRALSVGAFLMLCAVGHADSFFGSPPGELAGLSRTEIVAALGNPSSFAASNGQEILVYSFGRIDLTNGKVVSADERVRTEYHRRISATPVASAKPPASVQPQQPGTPVPAQLPPLPSAAAPKRAGSVAGPSPTGLEPFIKMVGILAGCVVAVGFVRILALKRRHSRSGVTVKQVEVGRTVLRIEPAVAIEDPRPWHDYDADQNLDASMWSFSLLRALEWKRFEDLTAAYFAETGFVAKTTRTGADGGVDVELFLAGRTKPDAVVQCKAWNSYTVGVKPVRELFGVMAAAGVARGVFITTSTFTDEARSFACAKNLELIDGEALLERIDALPAEAQGRLLSGATEGDYTTPSCPKCGTKMIHRTAGKGRDAGDSFWGCAQYPRCRHTFRKRRDGALA